MARKVLFITGDQWRGEALSALGHPAARTPHLDRLAASGATFTRHFTSSVPCGPARTTLLTGLYPFIHRSIRNGAPLDKRHTNIALEVRRAGFDPVLFGYTDSSADPRELAPEDPRLKSYEGVLPGFRLEASLNEACLAGWLSELARKGYAVPERHADIYLHPETPRVLDRFDRGPAVYRAEDSDTAYIADKVIDYLRLRRKQDWFIHAVFLRPHPPIIAPHPYNTMVPTESVPQPVRHADRGREAAVHPFLDFWLKQQANPAYFESQVDVQALPDRDLAEMRAVYYGLINEVDHQIGRILAHLEATGELDETLVVFTSDHGEMLGDHWCWGKAGWFDAANFIPLIVRDPRAPAEGRGRRIDAFTESVDVTPTILDWLGLEIPTEMSGHSLGAWLGGKTPTSWRNAVFWEYDFREPASQQPEQAMGITSDQATLNVVRDRRYKYVHFTGLPPLLYDLAKDPGELTNVAADSDYLPVVAEYAQKLLSHRMLHAERTLANATLTPTGVKVHRGPRGAAPGWMGAPE
ncbi:MAG: alkaline phosphatase family protein [Hyphomicrobiaceae bacterium]